MFEFMAILLCKMQEFESRSLFLYLKLFVVLFSTLISTIKYLLFLLFESLKKGFERERLKNMRCSAYF